MVVPYIDHNYIQCRFSVFALLCIYRYFAIYDKEYMTIYHEALILDNKVCLQVFFVSVYRVNSVLILLRLQELTPGLNEVTCKVYYNACTYM